MNGPQRTACFAKGMHTYTFSLWTVHIRNQVHDQKVKEAGIGAATEAATGYATSAFFHKHYSKILDAPLNSAGPVTKKNISVGTTRTYVIMTYKRGAQ